MLPCRTKVKPIRSSIQRHAKHVQISLSMHSECVSDACVLRYTVRNLVAIKLSPLKLHPFPWFVNKSSLHSPRRITGYYTVLGSPQPSTRRQNLDKTLLMDMDVRLNFFAIASWF